MGDDTMSLDDERERFWRAIEVVTDRVTAVETSVDQRREVMRDTIREAVQDAMPRALLTDKQHRWVELAIEREAQSIAFRQAVIEKSTSALVWAVLAGAGYMIKEWLGNHGVKW